MSRRQISAMEMMAIDPKPAVSSRRAFWPASSRCRSGDPVLRPSASSAPHVVAVLLIGVDGGNFWSIMQTSVDVWRDVGNGVVKGAVFGIICTAVALYQGLQDRRHAGGRGPRHHHAPSSSRRWRCWAWTSSSRR